MQQQGLVASQWYKNFAKRCFREGTENDIRKYMISSQLSNVSDCHIKSHLVLTGTVARAPFLSCQIQHLTKMEIDAHASSIFIGLSLCFNGVTDCLRDLFLRV